MCDTIKQTKDNDQQLLNALHYVPCDDTKL